MIFLGEEPTRRAGASIYHREEMKGARPVTLRLKRMDDILGGKTLEGPTLLKIDAQGSDIEVLRGGTQTVRQCDVVVVQTGLHPLRKIHRVMGFMETLGLAPYDFLSPLMRPFDNALGQIDIAFVHEDARFRHHPAWA